MVDMKTHDVIPSNMTSPHRENNNYHGYNPLPLSVLHNAHSGPPPILEKGNSNMPHLNKVKVRGDHRTTFKKHDIPFSSEVKQKMEDERLAEEQAQAGGKKKRKFKNPFKKRPKTREEKIEAWLEN